MARTLKWFTRIVQDGTVPASGQTCVDVLRNVEEANRKGLTITRIIMDFVTLADAVAERTECFWGIVLVNSDAAAADVFPDPATEADNVAWLGRGMHVNGTSDLLDSSNYSRTRIDLRAQRVTRSAQEELHLIIDQSSGGGIVFNVHLRVLCRLP